MRSVFKSVLVALVAVLALSAIAAASASAYEFGVEGTPIGTGISVPFTATGSPAVLNSAGLKIECTSVTGSGDLQAEGKSTLAVELASCTVSKPAYCQIAQPIKFNTKNELTAFEGKSADAFDPETGALFAELELKNNGGTCAFSTVDVEGILQSFVENAATAATSHTLLFNKASGSYVEMAGKTSKFELTDAASLSGAYAGKKWSVMAPSAGSELASGVSETGATLNGIVNPNGAETKYYFEYGQTTAYGSKTAEASAGSGTSELKESKTITGLTSGTEYHYRMVATNNIGATTYGEDQTFGTKASFLIEGSKIGAEEKVSFSATSPEVRIYSSGFEMICRGSEVGYLLAEGKSTFTGEMGECYVAKPSHCAVAGPIKLDGTAELTVFNGKIADTFYPEGTTIGLENSGGTCSFSSITFEGKLQAIVEGPEYNLVSRTLAFTEESGSEMTGLWGHLCAFDFTETIKLSGSYVGRKWSTS